METPPATLTGDGLLLVAIQHATSYLSSISSPEKILDGRNPAAPEDVERLIALFSKGSPSSCGEVDTGAVAQVLAVSLARLKRPLMLNAREAARAVGGCDEVAVLKEALQGIPPQRVATLESLVRLIASLSDAISPGGGNEGLDVLATTFGPLIIKVDARLGPTLKGAASLTRAMVEHRARLFPEVTSFRVAAAPTTSVPSGGRRRAAPGSHPVAVSGMSGASGPSSSADTTGATSSRSADDGASCSSMDDITSTTSSQASQRPAGAVRGKDARGGGKKRRSPGARGGAGGGRGQGSGRRPLQERNSPGGGRPDGRGKENASEGPPQRQLWSPRSAAPPPPQVGGARASPPMSFPPAPSPPTVADPRGGAGERPSEPSAHLALSPPGRLGAGSPAVGGGRVSTPGSAPSRKQLELWFHRLGGALASEVAQALEAQQAQHAEWAREEMQQLLKRELDRRGEELLGSLAATLERHQGDSREQMAALLAAQQRAVGEALRATAGELKGDLARHRKEVADGMVRHEVTMVQDMGDLMVAQQADLKLQAEGLQAAVDGHAAAALAASEEVAAQVAGRTEEVVAAVVGHAEGVAAEVHAAAGELSARVDALAAAAVAPTGGGGAGPVMSARVAPPPPGTDAAGELPGAVRPVAFGASEAAPRGPRVPSTVEGGRKGGAGAWLLERWRSRGVAKPIMLVAASALLSALPSQGPAPASKWHRSPRKPIQVKIPARIKIPCES